MAKRQATQASDLNKATQDARNEQIASQQAAPVEPHNDPKLTPQAQQGLSFKGMQLAVQGGRGGFKSKAPIGKVSNAQAITYVTNWVVDNGFVTVVDIAKRKYWAGWVEYCAMGGCSIDALLKMLLGSKSLGDEQAYWSGIRWRKGSHEKYNKGQVPTPQPLNRFGDGNYDTFFSLPVDKQVEYLKAKGVIA